MPVSLFAFLYFLDSTKQTIARKGISLHLDSDSWQAFLLLYDARRSHTHM